MFAALAAQREAVALLDPGNNAYSLLAVNVANRLIFAFDVARDPALLNEAVELISTMLDRPMPDEWRAAALDNLGLALRARF